jgi:pimeloyl-ACP methyl ester carboxylesterase
VLIHGAGDSGWYWHLVAAELRSRGHDVVAPDLPGDDESTGLNEYAVAVVEVIGDRRIWLSWASRSARSPRPWSPIGSRLMCWFWWPG